MKKPYILSLLVSLFLLFIQSSVFASPLADSSLAPMLQKVTPSIVNIKAQIKITDINTFRDMQKQQQRRPKDGDDNNDQQVPTSYVSVGSGVVVDAKNGYIITNSHVVSDAQQIIITLADNRHFTAKVIGADKPSDIALLQIKAKNLTAAPIADSNKVKVGDFVVAIGNPFGLLNQSVTSGIVSAVGRSTLGIENYENFIQTDAPINPGNSGGGLISMQGELIGINTAILGPDRGSIGIGFAIPSNMAKSIMMQLLEYGNVKRGVLGIGAQDITPELASAFNAENTLGAAITQVLPNSPAQQAGLKVGDIITKINGSEVKNASDVVNTIGFLRVDSKVTLSLLRNSKSLTANVTLSDPGKRKQITEQSNPFLYGVGLKNYSAYSPIHGNVHGIIVMSVQQDSLAWQSDMRAGDIVTSVNQQNVGSIEDMQAIVNKANKTLLLNVLRGPAAIFLVLNKEA